MKVIYKYSISIANHYTIAMPKGAQILTVQVQNGDPFIYALVDPNQPKHEQAFMVFDTGQSISDDILNTYAYIGMFRFNILVYHLFSEKESTTNET